MIAIDEHQEHRNEPLVTIGIPTFNRPDGLRRTLESATAQTYSHLEIIIADNASPDPNVAAIAQEFANRDGRIKYFRHDYNIGAHANFGFLLARATGPLFMWWADDDERTADAIEYYVANIGKAGAFISTYAMRDYTKNTDTEVELPLFTGQPRTKRDIALFLKQTRPHFLYGLLRTEAMRACWSDVAYDWLECNILLKLVANYGYKTLRSEPKFFAGIIGPFVVRPNNGVRINPWPYFFRTLPLAMRGGLTGFRTHCKSTKHAWRFGRTVARATANRARQSK